MPTTNDVYEFLNSVAPMEMKMDSDNPGFLAGFGGGDASKMLVALDITHEVISEAWDIGAGLIVSHHPLIFCPLKKVVDTDNTGNKIIRLLTGGVSAICMHTNLDAALGGVGDALAVAAGIADAPASDDGASDTGRRSMLLADDGALETGEVFSYGRFGYLEKPSSMQEYLPMLKSALKAEGLRYYDAGKDVYKIAVVGGAGGDAFERALEQGCDTFVTADIKYHLFLEAKERGLNLIDGDHFSTENLVVAPLSGKLRRAFPEAEVFVSKTHRPTAKFY